MKCIGRSGEDVDDETEGWMLELLQLMQMQADAEAMEEEQSILQTEMQAEENGIFFVDSDNDDEL